MSAQPARARGPRDRPRDHPGVRSRDQTRDQEWQPVCRIAELEVERGVTALVHGQAVAIFRGADDQVFALGNHDPVAKTSTLARGIVGRRGEIPFVASPAHRHAFDLRTGRCLEDPHLSVPAYAVAVIEGVVLIGHRKTAQA